MAADHTEAARPAAASTATFGPPRLTSPAMLGDLGGALGHGKGKHSRRWQVELRVIGVNPKGWLQGDRSSGAGGLSQGSKGCCGRAITLACTGGKGATSSKALLM